jgi:hypothetical protein
MTTTEQKIYEGLTAEQWRAKAVGSRQSAAESWERSDTDGFMSQWASGVMAQEYEAKATLAEDGGLTTTRALFFAGTGEVASTHFAYGQWGGYWVLNDEATEAFGKRFLSESKASTGEKQRAFLVKKGFTVGRVRVKGYVATKGANATSVRAGIFPDIDALKAGEYEVIETDIAPGEHWY